MTEPLGRSDDPSGAAHDVDLVVIATPDAVIADVASKVKPVESTVVAHLAGSLGLDVLAPHARTAAIHPLASLANPTVGARLLADHCRFAVAGDPMAARIVADLGGTAFEVEDDDRAAYHAAATIASNHLVALFGQLERVASSIGLPLDAFMNLARASLDNVEAIGPVAALTGPVSRADWPTVRRHLAALEPDEKALYEALAAAALTLAHPTMSGQHPWRA